MNTIPTIIVLAAGQGSRFQATRQRYEQPLDDSTVLATTVANAVASGLPVLVVTTARRVPLVAAQLALHDLLVVPEAEAQRGAGHAIAAGVGERPESAGWLLLPGDMPRVQPQTMLAVAGAVAEHTVVFAQYGGRRGHPLGFSAELYSELASLHGDDGARRLLARYPAVGVPVDDPGVVADADADADLDALRAPRWRAVG